MKEVRMKEWRKTEALKQGVSEAAVANQLWRGKWPQLQIRRVTKRTVFVGVPEAWPEVGPF